MQTISHSKPSRPFCKALWSFIIVTAVGVWMTGCVSAASLEKEAQRKYSRRGESMIVPYSETVVSSAIISWAKSLTNGYSLYDNVAARRNPAFFKDDPATIFLLSNDTNAIAPWGRSACLPSSNSLYWARVIIRVRSAAVGNQVSVAIHGEHFVRGLAFNIHTYEFDHEKDVDLPPCPQDEREVLSELESTMRKAGEANPPAVPHKR